MRRPTPPPRRVELRNLSTGEVRSWQDIGTFAFSATSTHVFLRRRGGEAPAAAGGRGGGGTPPRRRLRRAARRRRRGRSATAAPRGADTILLDLRTGRHQLLGSVGDIAFNRTGELLAYTVDAAVKDANGLFVFDTRNGRITPLDNDGKSYNRLTWSEDGNAIAVLKGSDVEKMREKDNVLLAFRDVAAALKDGAAVPPPVVLEPAKAEGFPKGWVVSDRAALAWSEDDKRVFFGIEGAGGRARHHAQRRPTRRPTWTSGTRPTTGCSRCRWSGPSRTATSPSARRSTCRRRSFVKLTDETMRDLDIGAGRQVGRRPRPARLYPRREEAAGRRLLPRQHLHRRADADRQGTADRRPRLRHLAARHALPLLEGQQVPGSTTSRRGRRRRSAPTGTVSFIDIEYDHPGTKPSYGIAGYTSDGKAVIVNHRYDLWLVPLDGSAPTNLTGGLGDQGRDPLPPRSGPSRPTRPCRARSVRAGRSTSTKPVTLSAYGEWTKKSGYYELAGGQMKELVYEDASFGTPVKARKADRFLFTRQTFVEFPDLRVSGPGFTDSKKITDANPQQKDFLWGHRVLFDFKNKDGVRLQGILAVPDDYKPGEKRPMIVMFYEKNSQNMHVSTAPPAYLPSMGRMPVQAVSDGYLTMLPDIHFRTGSSHSRHAGVRRGGHAQGDRDGLRRSEAHRRLRPQLQRRGRGLHRDDVEDVRGGRDGRGRRRPLQRLQHELGLGLRATRAAAATPRSTTTSTARAAGASRPGTSPTGTATSRR